MPLDKMHLCVSMNIFPFLWITTSPLRFKRHSKDSGRDEWSEDLISPVVETVCVSSPFVSLLYPRILVLERISVSNASKRAGQMPVHFLHFTPALTSFAFYFSFSFPFRTQGTQRHLILHLWHCSIDSSASQAHSFLSLHPILIKPPLTPGFTGKQLEQVYSLRAGA